MGPLGSSSFNLPTVERALVEMEGGGTNDKGGERDGRRAGAVRRVSPEFAFPKRLNHLRLFLLFLSLPLSLLGRKWAPYTPFNTGIYRNLFYAHARTCAPANLPGIAQFSWPRRENTT